MILFSTMAEDISKTEEKTRQMAYKGQAHYDIMTQLFGMTVAFSPLASWHGTYMYLHKFPPPTPVSFPAHIRDMLMLSSVIQVLK